MRLLRHPHLRRLPELHRRRRAAPGDLALALNLRLGLLRLRRDELGKRLPNTGLGGGSAEATAGTGGATAWAVTVGGTMVGRLVS